jgi:acetyl-CoA acetyltransferase family protein
MNTAVIVDAVRTPLGRRNGELKDWHPVDLAGHLLEELVRRSDVDPALVDDVIVGCVSQFGDQASNLARSAALAAGFPDTVVGTTVDRQCGSSQQALHFAAQGVMAGAYDVVIAAGVESMSRVPMGSAMLHGTDPFGPRVQARYDMVPQGMASETVAEKWGITREESDAFALESHRRAARATAEGRFGAELVGVPVVGAGGATRSLTVDEGIRGEVNIEQLARLKPTFRADGQVTAGNSAPIADGASAVLVMSEDRARRLGLTPRVRFAAFALAGVDPVLMMTAPIPATALVLEKAKLALDDVDLVEVNEAFAAVVLAWAREHHPDMDTVNVNGGAIAIGNPLGCSGTRLTATLLHELERTGGRWALQVVGESGGMANAMVIERLG